MKKTLPILFLACAIHAFGQGDQFPVYKLVSIDSFDLKKDIQYLRTIKLVKGRITIHIDSRPYSFTSLERNDSTFITEYNSKYDLQISQWEIKSIDSDSVTCKIAYTKIHKRKGTQRGKHFIIDNLKIAKAEIAGVYVQDKSKIITRKISLLEIGLLAIIITGAILFGSL